MITTGLITFFTSTVLGAVFKLIATKIDNTRMLEEAKLLALNAKAKVVDDARRYSNKGFQITRRVIAISVTLTVLVLPILVPLIYPLVWPAEFLLADLNPSIWYGYDVLKEGLWPFSSDSTETVWKELKGVVITPHHTEITSAIIGLYFGTSISKR